MTCIRGMSSNGAGRNLPLSLCHKIPMATLLEILSDSTAGWTRHAPATDAAIEALTANCDFVLPEEYLSFLRYSNGGEGFLRIEPWYFQLWSTAEDIEYNRGYN